MGHLLELAGAAMKKNNMKTLSVIMLSAASLIWGTSFIAQILGMQYIGPYTFLTGRYVVSLVFLVPFTFFMNRYKEEPYYFSSELSEWRSCLKSGVACGAFLFIASALQQTGLLFTTASKAGFITATYIVIVPIYGFFMKKLPTPFTAAAIAMSMTGLYLLSITPGVSINIGDVLVFAGAFFWAAHIMACDKFSRKHDPLKISTIQFASVALFASIVMFAAEAPEWRWVAESWKPIVYAGLACTCIAYTLQMAAQRYVSPVATCIILSGETLFAAASGYLVLGERLSERELIGAAILLAATLMAQIHEIKYTGDQAL